MPQDKIRVSRHAMSENILARASRWVINPKTNNNDILQMPGDRFSGLVIDGATAVVPNGKVHIVSLSPAFYSASLERIRNGRVRISAQGNFEISTSQTVWFRFGISGIPVPTMPADVLVEITVENAQIRSQTAESIEFDLLDGYVINFRIAEPKLSSGRS